MVKFSSMFSDFSLDNQGLETAIARKLPSPPGQKLGGLSFSPAGCGAPGNPATDLNSVHESPAGDPSFPVKHHELRASASARPKSQSAALGRETFCQPRFCNPCLSLTDGGVLSPAGTSFSPRKSRSLPAAPRESGTRVMRWDNRIRPLLKQPRVERPTYTIGSSRLHTIAVTPRRDEGNSAMPGGVLWTDLEQHAKSHPIASAARSQTAGLGWDTFSRGEEARMMAYTPMAKALGVGGVREARRAGGSKIERQCVPAGLPAALSNTFCQPVHVARGPASLRPTTGLSRWLASIFTGKRRSTHGGRNGLRLGLVPETCAGACGAFSRGASLTLNRQLMGWPAVRNRDRFVPGRRDGKATQRTTASSLPLESFFRPIIRNAAPRPLERRQAAWVRGWAA
jgi:hypothetical protein